MEGSGVAAGDMLVVGGGLSDTRSMGGGNGIGVAVCAWGRGECASCPPKRQSHVEAVMIATSSGLIDAGKNSWRRCQEARARLSSNHASGRATNVLRWMRRMRMVGSDSGLSQRVRVEVARMHASVAVSLVW